MADRSTSVFLALGLGAVAGLRSMTAPALLSRHFARYGADEGLARLLGTSPVPSLLAVAAAGELVADKTPFVPNRTDPLPAAGRVAMGALMGVAVADWQGESRVLAALAGAAAALGTTFLGYHLRRAAADAGLPDLPVALAEDVVAVSTAAALAEAAG